MRDERQAGDGGSGAVMLVVAANAPSLVLRLLFSYLRAKRRVKAAGKEFLEAMVKGGVPLQEARSLAEVYSSSMSLRRMMRDYGFVSMAGRMMRRS
ncbi:MAG: hypothetical protein LUQ14_03835 [Methanomassiliicoccales archaeon]|nr:hypothetical protein [Methanomassiliicoccales archaeon]